MSYYSGDLVKMGKEAWSERIQRIANASSLSSTVLTGFNCVIDYVEFVNPHTINSLLGGLNDEEKHEIRRKSLEEPREIKTPEDFLGTLLFSFRTSKAVHVHANYPEFFDWLYDTFKGPDKQRMGGQAGIMSNQLSALKSKVISYPTLLSPKQAKLFSDKVLIACGGKKLSFLPPGKAARKEDKVKINWIFEYKPGETLHLMGEDIVAKRANRAIFASHASQPPIFDSGMEKFLPELGKKVDHALLSGFQSLNSSYDIDGKKVSAKEIVRRITQQLKLLRSKNSNLMIHFEYVPAEEKSIEKLVIESLTTEAKSMGINEVEIIELLRIMGFDSEADAIKKNECSFTLYAGAKKIFDKLKLQRIHVHNLGYYVIILKRPYSIPMEQVRDSAVYASLVTNAKAVMHGGFPGIKEIASEANSQVSDTGMNQLGKFESDAAYYLDKRRKIITTDSTARVGKKSYDRKVFLSDGIIEFDDHYVLIIPTPIARNPFSTVGLGDVTSSVALIAETGLKPKRK